MKHRQQEHLPHGVVQNSKKYKIIVKTWAEIIGDASHRLKFVERSLQYESTRDKGLAHMRKEYADYLPATALGDIATVEQASTHGSPEAVDSDPLDPGSPDNPASEEAS